MSRIQLTCLAAVAVATAAGVAVGGRTGVGVAGGALLGGAVGLTAHHLLASSLDREFEASLKALLGAFALKLAALCGAWAALTFVPSLGVAASASALILTFVATAVVLLGVGSLDLLRALQLRTALSGAGAPHTLRQTPLATSVAGRNPANEPGEENL
jgi:hypothetical protein